MHKITVEFIYIKTAQTPIINKIPIANCYKGLQVNKSYIAINNQT